MLKFPKLLRFGSTKIIINLEIIHRLSGITSFGLYIYYLHIQLEVIPHELLLPLSSRRRPFQSIISGI